MAVTVLVRSGDAPSLPELRLDAPLLLIGRGDGCEVRLPDPSVSHRHASLRQRGGDWLLVDEGSTNGTFVGSVRLAPQAPRVLRTVELVRVGRIWLELRVEPGAAPSDAGQSTRELALALVEGALRSEGESSRAVVRVTDGPDRGKEASLGRDRALVVGRARECDLVLDDPGASRRHLELRRRGTVVVVRDLGSKNGFQLGDDLVPAGQERAWPPGTPLCTGDNRFALEDPVAVALEELERAVDEPLAAEEEIAPPTVARLAARDEPDELDPLPEAAPVALPAARPGPVAVPPRGGSKLLDRAGRPGFGGADALVLLLAVLVLLASGAGLWWLFRLD